MKHRNRILLTALGLGLLLPSCNNSMNGIIYFELEGGSFTDPSFASNFLRGEQGTKVEIEIPDPVKEGYYFVGWREKTKDGKYRVINKRLDSTDGNSYYYYPYGSDTFYAYFEPLVTIQFDLTQGKEEGKLIAPELGAENFTDNSLRGYATKSLFSNRYLPTADAKSMHLNFAYWYTEYPFVSSTDENGNEHYSLDSSSTKGEYPFDKSFSSNMQFPLDSTITLYAKWNPDPKITVHFNMEGKDDTYSFQAVDTIQPELTTLMKEEFNIDYSVNADAYYYTDTNEKKYRFAGFYLDESYSKPFHLDNNIYSNDIDLYLKWEKELFITLDYKEGTKDGKHQMVLDGYYENDILKEEDLKEYAPAKENADFLGYTRNGTDFRFNLPLHEDITLEAKYDDYPTLTLHYDYPIGYSEADKMEDTKLTLKKDSDIEDALNQFESGIQDESLVCKDYYHIETIDGKKKTIPVSEFKMPSSSMTWNLTLDYKAKLILKTMANISLDYEELSKEEVEKYFKKDSSLSESNFPDLKKEYKKENNERPYLFDGLYSDHGLTKSVFLPVFQSSSHTERPMLTIYRKMTKAILLSFEKEDGSKYTDSLYVIPEAKLSDYLLEIEKIVGSNKKLYLKNDDGTETILSTLLPGKDSTIIVKSAS